MQENAGNPSGLTRLQRAAFAKQGDIIVSQDDEFPEFYVQVKMGQL